MWRSLWQNVLLVTFSCVLSHEHHEAVVPSTKAEQIRQKVKETAWTASDFLDAEHLKSELKEVTQLQANGEISRGELSAYFFRIHDFDGNQLLDGLEIAIIMRHMTEENFTDETVAKAVDATMHMDLNNDGFVDYPELMFAFEREKIAEKQNENAQPPPAAPAQAPAQAQPPPAAPAQAAQAPAVAAAQVPVQETPQAVHA